MKLSIPEREKLALELARARECAGVSQRRVAREAMVHSSMVGQVEAGTYHPPPRLLRAYAVLCGLKANDLLISWCYVPDSLMMMLRQNPALCEQMLEAA